MFSKTKLKEILSSLSRACQVACTLVLRG